MAKNLYETADDTLRGESVGQLSPEAQGLWDKYNQVFGNIQNMPMKNVRLKSGAIMPIMDPGLYYKQRALQKVLAGMSATGVPTRAKPQPGALSQLAPFVTALGGDKKFQEWLAATFGSKGNFPVPSDYQVTDYQPSGSYDLGGGSPADFYAADATDVASDIDWGALGDAGYW